MLPASGSIFIRLFVLAVLVLLQGCSDSSLQKEKIPSASSIKMAEPDNSQPPDASVKTSTISSVVTLATSTITVVPPSTRVLPTVISPTWTPIPPLPSEKALEKLLRLYDDNGGCQLPCWWGITPGQTTWQLAREILFTIGIVHGPLEQKGVARYEPEYSVPVNVDPLGYIWPIIWVKDNTVIAIGTNSRWIMPDFDYSLAGVLGSLGEPDEIWLKIVTDTIANPHYDIRLFYKERGIEVGADGDAMIHGDKLQLCPQEFKQGGYSPGILLWAPSEEINFENLNNFLGNLSNRDGNNFYPLENFTKEYDSMTFYKTFTDPTSKACLDFELDELPQ